MINTHKQFEAVVEFMKVAGQEVLTEFKYPSTKLGRFRLRLINEEICGKNELIDSLEKDNAVGVLDGICDVLYVTYGAYASFGVDAPTMSTEFVTTDTGNILPMHEALNLVRYVKDSYEQLERGLTSGDKKTIFAALSHLLINTIALARASNFDLIGAFEEVHASNMSKFCSSEEEALESIELRRSAGKEDYAEGLVYVDSVVVDGVEYFTIKRTADGKGLKGKHFFEPDLSKYLK